MLPKSSGIGPWTPSKSIFISRGSLVLCQTCLIILEFLAYYLNSLFYIFKYIQYTYFMCLVTSTSENLCLILLLFC